MYSSIKKYDIKTIVDLINSPERTVNLEGYDVSVTGTRLKTFAQKGTDCICCGAKGAYFSLEKHTNSKDNDYHLNLYAINKKGNPVLMTRDHIILKSCGGNDTVENMNPMCLKCNNARSNYYENVDEFIQDYRTGKKKHSAYNKLANARRWKNTYSKLSKEDKIELVMAHVQVYIGRNLHLLNKEIQYNESMF